MIKILGVNGSPRKYGNTFKMLSLALKAVKDMGGETELINIYEYRIEPCRGCVSENILECRYPCIINDDMKIIYDKILDSNGIIIATPVYWYNLSGYLKNMVDRLTALENMINIEDKSWLEGKVAGVIAVGDDSGVIEVIANLYVTLNSMGMIIPPWALAYINRRDDVENNLDRLMDAYNVGRCVFLMAKILEKYKIDKWYLYDKKRIS